MVFVIGLLTVALVLVCLFLILLVLMQLPKKEAGAGLAFGAGATDALFGAGSGNFLTKATKYTAIAFFVLALILGILQNHYAHGRNSELKKLLEKPAAAAPAPAPAAAPATPALPSATPSTNIGILAPAVTTTNSAQ